MVHEVGVFKCTSNTCLGYFYDYDKLVFSSTTSGCHCVYMCVCTRQVLYLLLTAHHQRINIIYYIVLYIYVSKSGEYNIYICIFFYRFSRFCINTRVLYNAL